MDGTSRMRYRAAGSWPEDPATDYTRDSEPIQPSEPASEPAADPPSSPPPLPKAYPPKTCRICLETVYPTYHPVSENIPAFLHSRPRVTYESSDPELGRLLRPCKCKGSSRYVHEQCLALWRNADPAYGRRNYYQCPTCGFQYRLARMKWGQVISSPITQIVLTLAVLLLVMFLLGFVADPIINLYVDPFDTLLSGGLLEEIPLSRSTRERITWTEHFTKGLASLGVLSFLKVILAMSPWHIWNLRSSGLIGGRARRPAATGRDRASSISWIVIAVGVVTFLVALYKGVRAYTCQLLERAGQRVLDVPLEDDDEEVEQGEESETSNPSTRRRQKTS